MKIFTHLIIAGIGPGSPGLVTFDAIHEAEMSGMIIVPRSNINEPGIAEKVIARFLPERTLTPVLFPMTRDSQRRDEAVYSQLEAMRQEIESARRIFFPVLGDSMLYSTGAYLLEAMRKIIPVNAIFIPGISAHSLAASCAKRFLAMSDEILTIIPGTAEPEKISSALEHSDTAAIYKPSAVHNLREIIDPEKFCGILRVDYAGDPEREHVIHGAEALGECGYMSVLLLWR